MDLRALGLLAALTATPVLAADTLPDYAYDDIGRVTLATTAAAQCPDITTDDKAMQDYVLQLYSKLGKDGIKATDAAEHFQTAAATAEVAKREAAFREKYTLTADDVAGFCAAVVQEAAADAELGVLVKLPE